MNSLCSSLAAIRGMMGKRENIRVKRDFRNTLGNVPNQPQILPRDHIHVLENSNCIYQTVQKGKLGNCSSWTEREQASMECQKVSSSTAQEKPLLCWADPVMSQEAFQETNRKIH